VVQSLAALNTGDVRLDAPLDPDGDRSLIERFIAEDLPDTEDQAMDRFLSDEIEQALNTLQRRDAKVLRLVLRVGRRPRAHARGDRRMLGVTRERVRQLRDRALKRLRDGEVGRHSRASRRNRRSTLQVAGCTRGPARTAGLRRYGSRRGTCNVQRVTLL